MSTILKFIQIDNKSKGFFCLNYRTLDSKNNIIIDVHVTFNNVRNSEPILKRIDRIEEIIT